MSKREPLSRSRSSRSREVGLGASYPARAGCLAVVLGALQGACAPATEGAGGVPVQAPPAAGAEAEVSGFAREFVTGHPIPEATLVVLETGRRLATDRDGNYAFTHPVGARLTLQLLKPGFEPLQTDTVIVPAGGLTGPHDNLTFQALFVEEYRLFQLAIGMHPEPGKCHVVTTVAAHDKTMDDDPQGQPGATLVLSPAAGEPMFYFGVFKDKGPLANKTNPFVHHLGQTTADGGAAVFNLVPRDEPYTLTAAGPDFASARPRSGAVPAA